MKLHIIMFAIIFIIAGCSEEKKTEISKVKKEENLEKIFTQDSTFGVYRGMTFDELKNLIKLSNEVNYSGEFESKTSPTPLSFFKYYTYYIYGDTVCAVSGHNESNIEEEKIIRTYDDKLRPFFIDEIYGEPFAFSEKNASYTEYHWILLNKDEITYKVIIPYNNNKAVLFLGYKFKSLPECR